MKPTQTFLTLVFILIISSCNYINDRNTSIPGRFMPGEYFSNEAKKLNSRNLSLEKTVFKNGKSEIIVLDSVNWFKELKPFIDINIAKPAQINSYQIDSLVESNVLTINYIARDSTVSVKEVIVKFKNKKLLNFRAIQSSYNLYYQSIDTINYFGDGNYRISAMSKPKLGREVNLKLHGKAIEKVK